MIALSFANPRYLIVGETGFAKADELTEDLLEGLAGGKFHVIDLETLIQVIDEESGAAIPYLDEAEWLDD